MNRSFSPVQLAGDLVVFANVVEKGSFTSAAIALHMAKSQVTKQVARLEKSLGVTLLHRTTRQMTPTAAGLSVLQHAKATLVSADAAANSANLHTNEVSGRLSISASMAYGQSVVSRMLPGFLEKHPLATVELVLTDRHVDLLNEEVHLAFRLTDDPPLSLVGRPLHDFSFVLAGSAAYLRDHPVNHPADLRGVSCMAFKSQAHRGKTIWRFRKGDVRLEVDVKGPVAVNSSDVIKTLALDNLGIALLPDFLIMQETSEQRLVHVLQDWNVEGPYGRTVWLLWLPQIAMPPVLRAFIDYALDFSKNQIDGGSSVAG